MEDIGCVPSFDMGDDSFDPSLLYEDQMASSQFAGMLEMPIYTELMDMLADDSDIIIPSVDDVLVFDQYPTLEEQQFFNPHHQYPQEQQDSLAAPHDSPVAPHDSPVAPHEAPVPLSDAQQAQQAQQVVPELDPFAYNREFGEAQLKILLNVTELPVSAGVCHPSIH